MSGIICAEPVAPAPLLALVLKPDSTNLCFFSSSGHSSSSLASDSVKGLGALDFGPPVLYLGLGYLGSFQLPSANFIASSSVSNGIPSPASIASVKDCGW